MFMPGWPSPVKAADLSDPFPLAENNVVKKRGFEEIRCAQARAGSNPAPGGL